MAESQVQRAPKRQSFLRHLLAPQLRAESIRFARSWFASPLSVISLFVLFVTGALLALVYQPMTASAYLSMQSLRDGLDGGLLLQSLHRWAAIGLFLSLLAHMAKALRRGGHQKLGSWLSGLLLLGLVAALMASGYLLMADQRSLTASRIALGLFGMNPAQATAPWVLPLLYGLHIALLPLLLLLCLVTHAWQLRREAKPSPGAQKRALLQPDRLWLWLATLLVFTLALFFTLAGLWPADLGPAPEAMASWESERAPWFLLWAQELAAYSVLDFWLVIGAWSLTSLSLPWARRDLLTARTALWGAGVLLLTVLLAQAWPAHWSLKPGSASLLLALLAGLWLGFKQRNVNLALGICWLSLSVAISAFWIIGALRGPYWGAVEWPWAF